MIIGVPKEIKNHEYRVGLTPRSVKEFINHGHKVLVQTNAGVGIGASDQEYADTGAEIIATGKEVFDKAEMIVKVKEPQRKKLPCLEKDKYSTLIFILRQTLSKLKGLLKVEQSVLPMRQ